MTVNRRFVYGTEKVIHTRPWLLTVRITDDCIDELLSGSGDPPLLQECVAPVPIGCFLHRVNLRGAHKPVLRGCKIPLSKIHVANERSEERRVGKECR